MIRDAARTAVAAAVVTVAIAYLLVRRRGRGHRDLKPANVIRRPRTGPLR